MSAPVLRSAQFRRERERAWHELERLVAEAERRGAERLSAESLARLPVLYRAAVSSLSVARAISLDANLLEYLEALTARAYLVVYGVRRGWSEAVRAFFAEAFPAGVRALSGALVVAVLATLLGGALGFALVRGDPEAYYALVPDGLAAGRGPASSREQLHAALYDDGSGGVAHEAFASFLFSHNTTVALLAFALGLLGGLPTLLLLLANGLVLGAFLEIHAARGLAADFLAWVLPHGVPELGAVVLCGAAGLALARALVLPGERSRTDALLVAGRSAGSVVLGSVVLLFAAGLIEGIFRQRVQSIGARWLVAALGAALLTLWIAAPWRRGRAGRPDGAPSGSAA